MVERQEGMVSDMPAKRKINGRNKIVIITNGENSEKVYFECYGAECRCKKRFKIKVLFKNGDPMKLVNYAKSLLLNDKEILHVWIVLDVDSFDIDSAMKEIEGNHVIDIAFSNPSFEMWFILLSTKYKETTHVWTVTELKKRGFENL